MCTTLVTRLLIYLVKERHKIVMLITQHGIFKLMISHAASLLWAFIFESVTNAVTKPILFIGLV